MCSPQISICFVFFFVRKEIQLCCLFAQKCAYPHSLPQSSETEKETETNIQNVKHKHIKFSFCLSLSRRVSLSLCLSSSPSPSLSLYLWNHQQESQHPVTPISKVINTHLCCAGRCVCVCLCVTCVCGCVGGDG